MRKSSSIDFGEGRELGRPSIAVDSVANIPDLCFVQIEGGISGGQSGRSCKTICTAVSKWDFMGCS